VWDTASGHLISVLRQSELTVYTAVFNRDGTRILTASGDTARVWDTTSARTMAILKGHNGVVRSAAFSPDETRAVTGSDDGTARVWDIGSLPQGNSLQVACAYLRMHDAPRSVSLVRVTDFPLTFDRPICETDPPPPDTETIGLPSTDP